jgi:hypothetical protein
MAYYRIDMPIVFSLKAGAGSAKGNDKTGKTWSIGTLWDAWL